jgi:hypothetical protein
MRMIGEGRFGCDLQVSFALLSAMVVVLWGEKRAIFYIEQVGGRGLTEKYCYDSQGKQ